MDSSERSGSDLLESIFWWIIKNDRFLKVSKFSDFVNSDDFIGKITSKSIRLQPEKKIWI